MQLYVSLLGVETDSSGSVLTIHFLLFLLTIMIIETFDNILAFRDCFLHSNFGLFKFDSLHGLELVVVLFRLFKGVCSHLLLQFELVDDLALAKHLLHVFEAGYDIIVSELKLHRVAALTTISIDLLPVLLSG